MAACPQPAQDEGQKQQFGFFGGHRPDEVRQYVVHIQRAFEGRIGEHQRRLVFKVGVARAESVHVVEAFGFDAVQEQVHGPDADHGRVELHAHQHLAAVVFLGRRFEQRLGVYLPDVLARRDQKARRTRRRVADHILGRRPHQGNHHLDDVAGRAKLSVLARRGDFGQQVFVDVALRIPVFHRDVGQQVHHLSQQLGRRNHERRPFHVAAKGRVGAQAADKVEHAVGHRKEAVELVGVFVFEAAPAEGVLFGPVDRGFDGFAGKVGLLFFQGLAFVESPQEEQVGNLFDNGEGVGKAAGLEGFPDFINF